MEIRQNKDLDTSVMTQPTVLQPENLERQAMYITQQSPNASSHGVEEIESLKNGMENKGYQIENPSDLSSIGTFHFNQQSSKGLNIKNLEKQKFGNV